jgi:hypothetical protein
MNIFENGKITNKDELIGMFRGVMTSVGFGLLMLPFVPLISEHKNILISIQSKEFIASFLSSLLLFILFIGLSSINRKYLTKYLK